MQVPDTLQHKIDVFRSSGCVVSYGDESFLEPSWVAIFLGQHVYPRRYDPFVDSIDLQRLRQGMRQRRAIIRKTAQLMPSHVNYITAHCAARA